VKKITVSFLALFLAYNAFGINEDKCRRMLANEETDNEVFNNNIVNNMCRARATKTYRISRIFSILGIKLRRKVSTETRFDKKEYSRCIINEYNKLYDCRKFISILDTLNRAISTVFVGVVGIGVIIGLNMC